MAVQPAALPQVASRRDDITETLHGEPVADPYRWLEDGESEETRAWTAAQNARTEGYLAAIPGRESIRARLAELLQIGSIGVPTPVRGRYLYLRREGGQDHPILYVRDGADGADRVALDVNALDPGGGTALDWHYPSNDGRLLAYGLSTDGSEASVLHLLDLDTLAPLPDRIPDTRAASVAWLPDGSAFYYTRYPAVGSVAEGDEHYHRAVWFHRIGDDPASDALVFEPAEKEHWPGVSLSPDGRWMVISVSRTFDATDIYLQDREQAGPLLPVAKDLAAAFDALVAHGRLWVRTNLHSPTYGLYSADPEHPAIDDWSAVAAPHATAVLEGFALTARHVAMAYLECAASRLVLARHDGTRRRRVELPALGSVYGLGSEWDGEELFYGFSSYADPPSIHRIDLVSGNTGCWRRIEVGIDPEQFEVKQVTCTSSDATPVSMFIVHPRGIALDGTNPTYLTGYGGFNISMTPAFSRSLIFWLERGGILAVPNLRGGGEYGESWHQGGMLERKQNTFDDCIAAAQWLVSAGYTSAERLAVAGGSNGGLLAGAMLTQRPDLFRAVVIQVPLLDMLRYHRFLIARLWIPEYGSADDPEQFRWLSAYSPYHRVRDGAAYPAVLLATAESDTRVDPMHARKMAARLQAATSSDRPVLLRLESKAGHGAGKPVSKLIEELSDVWGFVVHELGA
jgi:prolyl oligopeptidase